MKKVRRWFAALFGAALAVSISAALIGAGVFLVDWARRSLTPARERWTRSPLDVPLLAFYSWCMVTWVIRRSVDFSDAIGTQDALLLFFLFAHGMRSADSKTAMRWFCVASVAVAALGVFQSLSHINFRPDQNAYETPAFFAHGPKALLHYLAVRNDRAVGTRSHPLTYAEGFLPAFFFILVDLFQTNATASSPRGPRRRIAAAVSLVIIAGALIVSQARGAWLGIAGGVAVLLFISPQRRLLRRISFVLAFVFVVATAASPQLRGRAMSIISKNAGTASDQQSKRTRYALWAAARKEISEHPFVGMGPKGTHLMIDIPYVERSRVWGETHNIFLQTLDESGFIGFALWLWMILTALWVVWRAPEPWNGVGVASIVALLLAGVTESWTRDKEIAMIFWVVVGFIERLRLSPGANHEA